MKGSRRESTEDDMPPKLDSKSDTKRLNINAPAALLRKVNDWRRAQPDMPNVSEAIRRLVEAGLDADKKGGKGR